jgi:hypothetical protein
MKESPSFLGSTFGPNWGPGRSAGSVIAIQFELEASVAKHLLADRTMHILTAAILLYWGLTIWAFCGELLRGGDLGMLLATHSRMVAATLEAEARRAAGAGDCGVGGRQRRGRDWGR